MATDRATIARLPASIQDVAETLGLELVFKLVKHFGGVELKVPHKLTPAHPLMVLGEHDAQAVCRFVGGGILYVPMMSPSRRREVLAMEAAGKTRWEIARALGMSQRHVRRLANGQDDRQLDLFD